MTCSVRSDHRRVFLNLSCHFLADADFVPAPVVAPVVVAVLSIP